MCFFFIFRIKALAAVFILVSRGGVESRAFGHCCIFFVWSARKFLRIAVHLGVVLKVALAFVVCMCFFSSFVYYILLLLVFVKLLCLVCVLQWGKVRPWIGSEGVTYKYVHFISSLSWLWAVFMICVCT